jgi:hypothetical protein
VDQRMLWGERCWKVIPCARRCKIRRARTAGIAVSDAVEPQKLGPMLAGWQRSAKAISRAYRLPPRPFLARLREDDRLALFRALDLRPPERDELRALLRADFLAPRLADLAPLRADPRALFLAPLRVDFLLRRLAVRLVDFLRGAAREVPAPSPRLDGDGSSKSKDDGDDAGEGEGGLSEGSGSIHPEPDQPISI